MDKNRKEKYQDWPFIVVGCIVRKNNKFLLVQELKKDKGLWNHPAGWLEKGEDIISGAKREVKEETGLDVEFKGLVGIFNLIKRNHPQLKDIHAVKLIFAADTQKEDVKFDREELMDAKWFTREETEKMGIDRLRDSDIKTAVRNFSDGKIFPLELINHQEVNY